MITHIRGQLVHKKPGRIIMEVGGFGLEISAPLTSFLALPEPPAEVTLLTHLVMREESWEIFGFLTPIERESFLALTSVTRIGPKLALTIISSIEPGELARALMTRDLAAISAVKGIGTKTAERLLVELKDKAPALAALAGISADLPAGASAAGLLDGKNVTPDDEAVSALMNLGYSKAEAEKGARAAHKEAGPEADLGALLRLALKHLTK